MRSPFRAVLFGVLLGAALFFVPFAFGFIFFIFFFFFISRLLFWGAWRGRRYYRNEIISIDGRDAYYERAHVPGRKIHIH